MTILQASLWIASCGAVGGLVSALFSEDRGLALPRLVDGVVRLGFLGHVITGALAAWLSWALYGPLAGHVVIGTDATGQASGGRYGLTLTALAGAAGVGLGGAKWLQSYVEKKVLKVATTTALEKPENPQKAADAAKMGSFELARMVRSL